MNSRRSEDRLYTAVVLAFLLGLVALGLLGVPALLVAAIGAVLAALAIGAFHRAPAAGGTAGSGPAVRSRKVPEKYVPRVLESGAARRRRTVHRRRHRHAPPLPFR